MADAWFVITNTPEHLSFLPYSFDFTLLCWWNSTAEDALISRRGIFPAPPSNSRISVISEVSSDWPVGAAVCSSRSELCLERLDEWLTSGDAGLTTTNGHGERREMVLADSHLSCLLWTRRSLSLNAWEGELGAGVNDRDLFSALLHCLSFQCHKQAACQTKPGRNLKVIPRLEKNKRSLMHYLIWHWIRIFLLRSLFGLLCSFLSRSKHLSTRQVFLCCSP